MTEPNRREHQGYRALRGEQLVASSWCEDCPEARCECLLEVMARARKAGSGVRVVSPSGAELYRRERSK